MGARADIEVIARALVVRRACVLTCWNLRSGYAYLPGGHVEFGERAAEALAREMREELGARVRVGGLALVHENAFDTAKRRHHELNLVFHVELTARGARQGAAARTLPLLRSREPGIGFDWTPLAALGDIDLRPAGIRAWLLGQGIAGAGSVLTTRTPQGADFSGPARWPKS